MRNAEWKKGPQSSGGGIPNSAGIEVRNDAHSVGATARPPETSTPELRIPHSALRTPLRPLSWYRDLHDARGRREAGAFLVEGPRAVGQIARVNPDAIVEILADGTAEAIPGVSAPVRVLSPEQIRKLCASRTPQGILAVVTLPGVSYGDALPPTPGTRVVLLQDVQDPGNVGTLLRTAAALGFDGAILSDQCADPFAPKTVAATAGSVLSLWIRRTPAYREIAQTLRRDGFRLVATDMAGTPLSTFRPPERLILALGNEGVGLSSDLRGMADATVGIPVDPTRAESLNVAVCGAICMFSLGRRGGGEVG